MRAAFVAAAGAVLVEGLEVPTGHRAQGAPAEVVPVEKPPRSYMVEGSAEYAAMAQRHKREARTIG